MWDSLYELRLLTHHIVAEGRAAYDAVIAEPKRASEHALLLTMFAGHTFQAVFRYEALAYQSQKLRSRSRACSTSCSNGLPREREFHPHPQLISSPRSAPRPAQIGDEARHYAFAWTVRIPPNVIAGIAAGSRAALRPDAVFAMCVVLAAGYRGEPTGDGGHLISTL